MNTEKKIIGLSKMVKIKGILLIILGIIHIIGSFFEYTRIKTEMSKSFANEYILWFYVVGLFILFLGWIDLLTYKGIKEKNKWAWNISLITSFFTFITGLSGLIIYKWVLCPPYVLFVLGILNLIPIIIVKREFK